MRQNTGALCVASQLIKIGQFALYCFLCLFPGCFFIPSAHAQQEGDTASVPIDFSYAGYKGGGIAIPDVPAVVLVHPGGGDDTRLLQAAIDYVAGLPMQENGFRGALQLAEGKFQIEGQLQIRNSGIVLRGSGKKGTSLVATGRSRRTLLEAGNPKAPETDQAVKLTDQLVPAGSLVLTLEDIRDFSVGDRITVSRPSTKEWIADLGMDTLQGVFPELRFHWPAGSRDLLWDRTIVAIDPAKKQVTLDAPVTTAMEQRYGGGTVARVTGDEPLHHVGLENLAIESEFDPANLKDEEHAWFAIALDKIEDAWVRNVTARYFVSSAVKVGPRARRVSILNCRNELPVSEIGGYRRYSFLVEGQQVLVQECTTDSGINDFAIGFCAAGPNVFLNCTAYNTLGPSGSYESWASGVLYEGVRIEGSGLRLTYDMERAQAGGWTAANSVIWNCEAQQIEAEGPEDAPNWVIESKESLYKSQLIKRAGKPGFSTLTASAANEKPLPAEVQEFRPEDIPAETSEEESTIKPLQLVNGRFVTGGTLAWGGAVNDAWWLGQTSPANALDAGVSISRFVPGRTGPGLTEDLPALAARVVAQGTPFYQSGPAIWYDRRRDDHSIVERADGNVWAAFYELPWARSGKGRAWDGLSRYDLTKYNPWYFGRTRKFADLSDQHGIVLYHHLYNNHNLLETASHWIDFPWRPANNINDTGLPEPPPLEPRDRVHVANQFYDASNPKLRRLHRSYIQHVLDQLGEYNNIIFGLSFQYSGPLEFQRFFQETVAEWEKRNDRTIRLVLATSKNVTDSILADPQLAEQVAVIDMRYWHYLPDGTLWAPKGGQNLAFREMHPKEFGDPSSPEQVYRQVREYHERFPDKAIVAWHSGVGPIPALMAGGAQVLMRNPTAGHGQGRSIDRDPLDPFVQEYLSDRLMHMEPHDGMLQDAGKNWALADAEKETVLLYSLSGPDFILKQKLPKRKFQGVWFEPGTGKTMPARLPEQLKKGTVIRKPTAENWLLLLRADNSF